MRENKKKRSQAGFPARVIMDLGVRIRQGFRLGKES